MVYLRADAVNGIAIPKRCSRRTMIGDGGMDSSPTENAKMIRSLEPILHMTCDRPPRGLDTRSGPRADVKSLYPHVELGIPLLPGQVVGELGLLTPDQLRTQTLKCVEGDDLLQITYEQLKQLYYQNPQFGFYFLQLATKWLFENIGQLERELASCKAAAEQFFKPA